MYTQIWAGVVIVNNYQKNKYTVSQKKTSPTFLTVN